MTKLTLALLTVIAASLSSSVRAQSLPQLGSVLDARQEAAHKELRDAMLRLREVRARSCSLGNEQDCELVILNDIEVALLDIEMKYYRASRVAASNAASDTYKKAKAAADEARGKVSHLIDILK